MSARRSISWRAAVVDLKDDRANKAPVYRQKWVPSRGAHLAYQPSRAGAPTVLLGMVQTANREAVASVFGFFGTMHEVGRFALDHNGLRAAMLSVEEAIASGEAA